MRLHGALRLGSSDGDPLRIWAVDADDQDRPVEVELRVRGDRIVVVPVLSAEEELVTAPPGSERAGNVDVPIQRNSRLDGNDFS